MGGIIRLTSKNDPHPDLLKDRLRDELDVRKTDTIFSNMYKLWKTNSTWNPSHKILMP